MPFKYRFRRPSVTVDPVIFGFDPDEDDLKVLLVKRKDEPFKGHWAIPGGFVMVSSEGEDQVKELVDGDANPMDQGESIDDAARRELEEETGTKVAYMEQLYTFGTPGRDPRGRVISVAYMALVRLKDYSPKAGSDADAVKWFSVKEALHQSGPTDFGILAFDHHNIIEMAVKRLQGKVRYAPIGFNLLPPNFTMGQLQKLYELLLGREIDASNFAVKVKKVLVANGIVVKTTQVQKGQHRPAPLYRFDKRAYNKAVRDRFNFEI